MYIGVPQLNHLVIYGNVRISYETNALNNPKTPRYFQTHQPIITRISQSGQLLPDIPIYSQIFPDIQHMHFPMVFIPIHRYLAISRVYVQLEISKDSHIHPHDCSNPLYINCHFIKGNWSFNHFINQVPPPLIRHFSWFFPTVRCYFDVDRFPGVMNHVALTIDDVPCRLGPRNSMSFGASWDADGCGDPVMVTW